MRLRIQKAAVSFSLASFAAGALIFLIPQASHAVASALAPKSNPGVPASSHSVELRCDAAMGSYGCYQINADGNIDFSNLYTVPASQKLVILTISIVAAHAQRAGLFVGSEGKFSGHEFWILDKAGTYQFQYPSGIVVAAGKSMEVSLSDVPDVVYLYGYLRPQ
jgi:hypothetical protein